MISPSRELLASAGVYFIMSTWEVVHFAILVGLGKIGISSTLVFVRALIGAFVMAVLPNASSDWLPFTIMTVAILAIDMFPLRFLVLKTLK